MKILETIGNLDTDSTNVEDFLTALDDLLVDNTSPSKSGRISIYCPAGETRGEAEKGRIQMRTIVQDILIESSVPEALHSQLKELLHLTENDETNQSFWHHQADSLAVYVSEDGVRSVPLHCDVNAGWSMSGYWHLTPVLECAANAGAYWLLHLSQKKVNLYRGSHLGLSSISVPGMVTAFEESKAGLRNMDGDDPAGEILPPDRQDLSRFFSEVNNALEKVFAGSDLPLVISGVDHYLPLYEKVNTYQNLYPDNISATPEFLDDNEVNQAALTLLEDEFAKSRDHQFRRIAELKSSGKSVVGLEPVLEAASQGRVRSLIAPCGTSFWGTYDIDSGKTTKMEAAAMESRDLYQLAAEETLLHGGRIFYAPLEDMPEAGVICAELRY